MSRLVRDFRYAVRAFVRGRFVTGLAVLAFALGIGVTTAVFSIFNAVLLQPLAYPDPDELVAVYHTQPACATCPAAFAKSPNSSTPKRPKKALRRDPLWELRSWELARRSAHSRRVY
jgi:hypothetical protein